MLRVFATHNKKTLQPYSNVGRKTRNITRFNSFCSSVANKLAQVALFFVTRFTLLASHQSFKYNVSVLGTYFEFEGVKCTHFNFTW